MDAAALKDRYERVKAAVPSHVKLIAVSKTRSVEEIRALYDLGHRAFGENYPQELKAKQPVLPQDIEWHFIGHLQRSNVKHVVGIAHLIHGVDSEKLLDELDKRSQAMGQRTDVLLQVHIAQEETKHGFSPGELRTLLQQPGSQGRWPHLRIRGLMGMATNTMDRKQIAGEFTALAAIFNELASHGPFPAGQFTELSMGMTGDMDLAIAAGSTMVRVGTAIFGERG
jgi:pyridoxal phosphate enzyme (YggS family)